MVRGTSSNGGGGGRVPVLGVVFFTVFMDLVGFGVVIPVLPLLSAGHGAPGWVVGAIMAVYSLMQFLFSPVWGRWSDRAGRRPIMLLGTGGAAVSYAILAVGAGMKGWVALGMFFAGRMFSGVCGANLAVAQAAIADVTPVEKRSQRMALIGIAFGLGFILGPWLGGVTLKHFGPSGPGTAAGLLCLANFLLATVFLPETRVLSGAGSVRRMGRREQWAATMRHPQIGALVGVFFLATFAFASFETTLGLLVSRNFGLDYRGGDAATIGNLFAYCGIIGVLAQGGLIGRLLKVLGEGRLVALSLFLVGVALAALPYVRTWPWLLAVLGVLALGSSLVRPPVFGMISRLAGAGEQGATMGVAQSAGSLARVLGPIFAAGLFFVDPRWPYGVCAVLTVVTAVFVLSGLAPKIPAAGGPTGSRKVEDGKT